MWGYINNLAAGAGASAHITLLHLLLSGSLHNSLSPTRFLPIYWRYPLGHALAKHRLRFLASNRRTKRRRQNTDWYS
jgi:hypothetical protein